MPPQYALLMQRCWDEEATKRPTFEQVVACLELLLDNLVSSESEGRISEGVEEERTSSSSNASNAAGDRAVGAQVEDLVAAKVASDRMPSASIPTPGAGTARTPSASGSGARGLLRFLSKGSSIGGAAEGQQQQQQSGKGLAESVEGSSDFLSGPGTPGFYLNIQQLRGIRQWYMSNSSALQADVQADPEMQPPQGEGDGDGGVGVLEQTPASSYAATRLQPWLDQCVDALKPSALLGQHQGSKGRAGGMYGRRWWAVLGGGKLGASDGAQSGSATGSSSLPQPLTPRQSGARLMA
jgi:hypothetical protein